MASGSKRARYFAAERKRARLLDKLRIDGTNAKYPVIKPRGYYSDLITSEANIGDLNVSSCLMNRHSLILGGSIFAAYSLTKLKRMR